MALLEEEQGMAPRRHYLCRACGATRSKRSLMGAHMQRHHPQDPGGFCIVGKDKRRYECPVCGTSRSKLSLLRNHMHVHDSSQCEDISDSRQHVPSLPTETKKRKRSDCKECGLQVKKAAHLQQHLLSHTDELLVMHQSSTEKGDLSGSPGCTWLAWTKNERSDVSVAARLHAIKTFVGVFFWLILHLGCVLKGVNFLQSCLQRPFICPKDGCVKCYKRQDHLNRHLLRHEKNAHLCPRRGCIMVCSNQSNLGRHLRKHDLKGDQQWGRLEMEKKLKCPELDCQKTFRYPCRVQSHHAIAHGFHYAEILCGEPGCGERFQAASTLLEHIRTFHNIINCHLCGVPILRRSFKRHLMVHQASQAKLRLLCPFEGCGCSFANSSNLSVHVRVHHMGRRDYQCSFENCSRTFGYRHTRDNHENTSLHCHTEGDFVEEDIKFQSRPRGGRKPVTLHKVEDLFRKRVIGPKQDENSCCK